MKLKRMEINIRMNRSESREQAFIFLFESMFNQEGVDEILEIAKSVREEKISEFSKKLFRGTIENIEEIDIYIEKYLRGWTKDRLSKVVLSILRLAVFEICFCKENPVSVCINEAIELSKKYATQEDASYINGVLGSLNEDIEKNNISI